MAYVFGIEGVPIFEMLFVLFILLVIGLIFILLELKKLTAIIGSEKSDLTRFEADLVRFEGDKGKKSSNEVVAYVRNAMTSGLSEAQIKNALIQRGWPRAEVENIFKKIGF
ncbi:hypothetical protein KY348_01150 [Candidatus Woesearchaeota archaeon]|nr:hypothetical protein [Candidatus Woesearchaeota archaeon]